ncbi:glycoside hydrolase domain-containing protein [Streptomyces sp. V1I6]|uniref:glycoside hydrolase domain-containing protein n=1 Tax=Streptomyces sp. V1I6 TaxID=3042273 RepID=UPI0027863230|nr:glycoside hydrolase domain-containing protein [Streptomyces sp. V1I6]MDQ0846107.1 peptidoglycan hydrolase-like protein with peptidoglycan-binding domain [Streptomyces sp. V1I6]
MTDPMVLEAQRWVNETYGGVDGYVSCDTDGSTGWATVLSLTQALQHELGLSPVVQNFGENTLNAVWAHRRLPDSETNTNIIRIYNYALWCKGYTGSPRADMWDTSSQSSLDDLYEAMGVAGHHSWWLWARVTRALLRMDQFRLVPRGSATTREIQQYLNSTYVAGYTVPAMGLVPCDGYYARETQKGLLMAIQYEIGLPTSTITGYFGRGTTTALKQQQYTMERGDTGRLAYLFKAACWFNSPTYDGLSPIAFPWEDGKAEFTAATEDWVRAFQDFTQNAVHGMGTFQTWAELLISKGDESRPGSGSDTAEVITAEKAAAMRSKGFAAVGRYLDEHLPPGDPYYIGKKLRAGEAQTIIDSGLKLIPLFQYNGTVPANFTEQKGYDQGLIAHSKAKEHGIPPGACIYFAVDYDAQDHEIGQIISYFKGVRRGLGERGAHYQFGVYGTRNVCTRVSDATGARWSFVAGMSFEYSGNMGFPLPVNWSLNQIYEYNPEADPPTGFTDGTIAPMGLDKNVWRHGADPGVSRLNLDERYQDMIRQVQFVRRIEAAFDEYRETYLGVPESAQRDHVMTFFRHLKYYEGQWPHVLEPVPDPWIDFLSSKNLWLDVDFRWPNDPVAHTSVDFQHLMASCQGMLKYYSTSVNTTLGDGTGWLGDLLAFFAEWRNDYDHLGGSEFCELYLANPNKPSALGEQDLRADADAFNLAKLLHGSSGMKVSEALQSYYLTENLDTSDLRKAHRRFRSFTGDRFGGTREAVASVINGALGNGDENHSSMMMTIGRFVLLRDLEPWEKPWNLGDELDGFVDGIAGKLIELANAEPEAS